jgi:hypothetical protein
MRNEEEEKNSCGWEGEEGGASSTAKLLAQAVSIFTQQVKALCFFVDQDQDSIGSSTYEH